MSNFSRARSKVWWPPYFKDDDDDDDSSENSNNNARLAHTPVIGNWSRENSTRSSRGSSSSPSNGSQRSQDSGFSDSESSPLTSDSNSSGGKHEDHSKIIVEGKYVSNNSDDLELQTVSNLSSENSTLPTACVDEKSDENEKLIDPSPVRISKSCLVRRRKKENELKGKNLELVKSKCYSISSYLADCYFPLYNFDNNNSNNQNYSNFDNSLKSHGVHFSLPDFENRKFDKISNSGSSSPNTSKSSDSNNRTCFIVDELPKKNITIESNKTFSINETIPNNSEKIDSENLNNNKNKFDSEDKELERRIRNNENNPNLDDENNEEKTNKIFVQSSKNWNFCDVPKNCKNDFIDELDRSNLSKKSFAIRASKIDDFNVSVDSSVFTQPNKTSTPKKSNQRFWTNSMPKGTQAVTIESRSVDLPVIYWLDELQNRYEPECTITLQSKPIVFNNYSILSSLRTPTFNNEYIQTFCDKVQIITEEFANIYRIIRKLLFSQIRPHVQNVINRIMGFLINYAILLKRANFNMNEDLILLMDLCDRLRLTVHCPTFSQSLLNEIDTLAQTFSFFANNLLIVQFKVLLSSLEDMNLDSTVIIHSLITITNLSAKIQLVRNILPELGCVKYFLTICVKNYNSDIRSAALRALATVCYNTNCIRQLEQAGGIEMLSDMLSDISRPENELLEVISVLVQITAPWLEDNQNFNSLNRNLFPIIHSLTRLITSSTSSETLLMITAALANISYIESGSIKYLLEAGTINCLLTAVRHQGGQVSIFLQEQTAKLIGNMASVAEARPYLAENRAAVALICFLQVRRQSPMQTQAEINAAERLQHKSAIAISRLCSEPLVCKQIVELKGLQFLVRLCKDEKARSYRDDILVACLTSLRKIANNCGKSVLEELNAKELIETPFVDTYLLCSSRQESYV